MTIDQAIELFDQQQPSDCTRAEKLRWLSEYDAMVHQDVLCAREPVPAADFAGYDESTDGATVLLVPHPYDQVYPLLLSMHCERINGELSRYNNTAQLVNNCHLSFQHWYTRTHAAKPAAALVFPG